MNAVKAEYKLFGVGMSEQGHEHVCTRGLFEHTYFITRIETQTASGLNDGGRAMWLVYYWLHVPRVEILTLDC